MEAMKLFIGDLVANWPEIIGAASMIIGGFATLARFTPNQNDDRIIQVILDFINFAGMNNGKAKNAE